MTEQPGPPNQPTGPTPGDPLAGSPPPQGAPQPGPPPPGAPPAPPPAAPPGGGVVQPPPGYQQPPSVGPVAGELAIKRSLLRVVLRSVVSFGVYTIWWFFQYRKRMNAEVGKRDDAGLHTVGLFVPFLNYYIIYLFWKDISDARVRVGLSEIPVVAYVIGSIFIAPVFYGIMNAQLNEYWDRRTGGQAVDAPFTKGEKLATFVPLVLYGAFFLLVILIAIAAS